MCVRAPQTTTDAGRTILLILDRSVDLSSPSLHEFTYQAMVQDVVPLEDSVKYTYVLMGLRARPLHVLRHPSCPLHVLARPSCSLCVPNRPTHCVFHPPARPPPCLVSSDRYHTENMAGQQVDKAVVLDEEDELWARLRHRHIAETMETLKDEKEKLLSNSVAEKLKQQKGGGDSKSVKAIAAIARAMPEQAARVTKVPCGSVMRPLSTRQRVHHRASHPLPFFFPSALRVADLCARQPVPGCDGRLQFAPTQRPCGGRAGHGHGRDG